MENLIINDIFETFTILNRAEDEGIQVDTYSLPHCRSFVVLEGDAELCAKIADELRKVG